MFHGLGSSAAIIHPYPDIAPTSRAKAARELNDETMPFKGIRVRQEILSGDRIGGRLAAAGCL
jgi:hypothetical protein